LVVVIAWVRGRVDGEQDEATAAHMAGPEVGYPDGASARGRCSAPAGVNPAMLSTLRFSIGFFLGSWFGTGLKAFWAQSVRCIELRRCRCRQPIIRFAAKSDRSLSGSRCPVRQLTEYNK